MPGLCGEMPRVHWDHPTKIEIFTSIDEINNKLSANDPGVDHIP